MLTEGQQEPVVYASSGRVCCVVSVNATKGMVGRAGERLVYVTSGLMG